MTSDHKTVIIMLVLLMATVCIVTTTICDVRKVRLKLEQVRLEIWWKQQEAKTEDLTQ